MAQQKTSTASVFFRELLQPGLYKRNQGRIARQLTFIALVAGIALGCWSLSRYLDNQVTSVRYLVPLGILLAGAWIAYRIVNIPGFADFLIAVEAEMNKVTWPTRSALFRASLVVIIVIFVLATLLFTYDLIWLYLLNGLHRLVNG